jgi:formylglycine-generating enzyme required for sulfatase activity
MNGHLLRFSIPIATFALFLSVPSLDAENTKPKSGAGSESPNAKYFEVTKMVHALIIKKSTAKSPLITYSELVPKAGGSKLPMLHVKGGEFLFGSPADEEERKADEGPQKKVKIEPFWMSKHEISWKYYAPFYQNGVAREKDGILMNPTGKEDLATIVCQPTPQYHDMFLNNSFVNDGDHPAMDVTHHAASMFCQWLSAQTGHFYRLPTEAEWEYACRAGTTTRWSFGDDPADLGDHAWNEDNSNFTYQEVGLKKPNPWGFHDMHGNVAEWVLDQYSTKFYKAIKDGAIGPWNVPTTRYPRVVRGGSWDDAPSVLRSASRMPSEKGWKNKDPQVPKSIWYHTDSQHVGFRIVRPVKIPSAEEMHRYWNTDWFAPERNSEDL